MLVQPKPTAEISKGTVDKSLRNGTPDKVPQDQCFDFACAKAEKVGTGGTLQAGPNLRKPITEI